MNAPIRIRDTVALLLAVVAGAVALGQVIAADVHVPAARMLAAECQGFEALASVGATRMTCSAASTTANADLATLRTPDRLFEANRSDVVAAPASRG